MGYFHSGFLLVSILNWVVNFSFVRLSFYFWEKRNHFNILSAQSADTTQSKWNYYFTVRSGHVWVCIWNTWCWCCCFWASGYATIKHSQREFVDDLQFKIDNFQFGWPSWHDNNDCSRQFGVVRCTLPYSAMMKILHYSICMRQVYYDTHDLHRVHCVHAHDDMASTHRNHLSDSLNFTTENVFINFHTTTDNIIVIDRFQWVQRLLRMHSIASFDQDDNNDAERRKQTEEENENEMKKNMLIWFLQQRVHAFTLNDLLRPRHSSH